MTICNINQVRQSFFGEMNLTDATPDGADIIQALYRQFYSGSEQNSNPRCGLLQ